MHPGAYISLPPLSLRSRRPRLPRFTSSGSSSSSDPPRPPYTTLISPPHSLKCLRLPASRLQRPTRALRSRTPTPIRSSSINTLNHARYRLLITPPSIRPNLYQPRPQALSLSPTCRSNLQRPQRTGPLPPHFPRCPARLSHCRATGLPQRPICLWSAPLRPTMPSYPCNPRRHPVALRRTVSRFRRQQRLGLLQTPRCGPQASSRDLRHRSQQMPLL